ncbi:MAG TPA: phosphoribosylformylglycinamidine synthase subunit PurS [Nitrososphaeraceae archaeon]|nr:phosphoribosylformylglycinamidine synthase subunit PurS [Nitrososphaeraceae archaeon]
MNKYLVNVIIENKQDIGDPEGETVYKDLMINGGYSSVQSVRCGKCLKIIIKAKSIENARKDIVKMCDELRIYNPIVSTFTITGISIVK